MTPRAELARAWLRPAERSWWGWTEGGEVIAWLDGATIAFRDELQELVERLAPGGLPPFDALVAALAIARDGWRDGQIAARLSAELPADTLALARRVEALPEDLRRGVEAKTALLRYLLEGCERELGPDDARELARQMREELPVEALRPSPVWYPESPALANALAPLLPRLEQLDEDALRGFAHTGLEELPRAAEVELPDCTRARRLIDELANDPERRGLARAARDLMAALRLPRPALRHAELALGGIADLSHRGPLDRLLASELAHDDLTLTARLATGEALFLEPETPPSHPTASRALLVDCGLRMWGLPRLFAAASALGLAATTDPRGRVRAFRARGRRALPFELTERDGLAELLGALETDAHPGAALPEFASAAHAALADEEETRELCIVTSQRALADPGFRAALELLRDEEPRVVALDRHGRVRVMSFSARGLRTVQELTLDPRRLLAGDEPRPARRRRTDLPPELPAIFRADPFPLQLPFHLEPGRFRLTRDGALLALTHDRRVMHRAHAGVGGLELTAHAPPGRLLGFHVERDRRAWLSFDCQGDARIRLLAVDLQSGDCDVRTLETSASAVSGTFAHAGQLAVVHGRAVDLFDLDGGERRASVPLGRRAWLGGRAFRAWSGDLELFAGAAGAHAFEPLPRPSGKALASCLEVPGHDGPLLCDLGGELWWTAPRTRLPVRPLGGGVLLAAASRDGRRVLATKLDRRLVVDLEAGTTTVFERERWQRAPQPVGGRAMQLALEPELGAFLPQDRPVPARARGVTCTADGAVIVSFKNSMWSIRPKQDRLECGESIESFPTGPGTSRPFGHARRVPGTRIALRTATLADGSRVVADSRGLVHFVHADRTQHELTLVLQAGPLAGWTTEHGVFGAPFHAPDRRGPELPRALGELAALARRNA